MRMFSFFVDYDAEKEERERCDVIEGAVGISTTPRLKKSTDMKEKMEGEEDANKKNG